MGFCLLAALGACSSGWFFKNPVVEFKKVRVMEITAEAVVLEGTLDLFNPNEQALQFSGYDYTLQVQERGLIRGESREPFEIGKQKHSVITLPATIRFDDLSALLAGDLLGRDIPYRLSGTVHFKSYLGTTPLAFSHQGTFNLSEFLKRKIGELLSGS